MKPNGSGHDNVKPAANGQGSMENRGADRNVHGGARSESAPSDRKPVARGGKKSVNYSQRKPYSGKSGAGKPRGDGSGGGGAYSGGSGTDKWRGDGSGSGGTHADKPGSGKPYGNRSGRNDAYGGNPHGNKTYGDKSSERKPSGDRSAVRGPRDAGSSYRTSYSGNTDGRASGAGSNGSKPYTGASAHNKSYGNSPAERNSFGDRQSQRPPRGGKPSRGGASGPTARDVALTALRFVARDGAYAAQALDRAFRQLTMPLSEADRRLAASIFYFTLENRLRIETCLQRRFDAQPDKHDGTAPEQAGVGDVSPAEMTVQAPSAVSASPEQTDSSKELTAADDGSVKEPVSADVAQVTSQSESGPAVMAAAGGETAVVTPDGAQANEVQTETDAEGATEPASMDTDEAVPQSTSASDEITASASGAMAGSTPSSMDASDRPAAVSAPRRVAAEVMDILCLAAAQILYMDKIPDYAAVNEAVKQARRYASDRKDAGGTPAFVNAILRGLIRDRDEGRLSLPDPRIDPVGWLSQKCSLALPLAQRLIDVYGMDEALRIASWTGDRRVETVRPNRLRMSDAEFEAWLDKQGFEWSRGIVPGAYRVANAGRLAAHQGWFDGLFSIQGESAMLAALAMEVKPGMQVLDACAAPGGKTCLMAETMGGAGRVHAWDVHEHRVELIKSAARRLGLDNVRATLRDASKFNVNCADMMDAVLVDAPCSGLGVICEKPDIKYRMNEGGIAALVELQRAILDTCARYVRPGGLLVYSTCTLLPEENAQQVAAFLENHPEFEPDDGSAWLPADLREELHDGCLQILPSRHALDGFFIARLRRKRS